jgi:hypothetical protein
MSQAEVRQSLDTHINEFYRLNELWDNFGDIGIQICYGCTQPYICRAVMLFEPAKPIFHNCNLLDGTSIEDLRSWLELIDDSVEVATESITSYKFGITLSTQDYQLFNHEPPETVLVFERGYFDDLKEG